MIRVLHSLKQKRLQRKKLRSILIIYMQKLGWQLPVLPEDYGFIEIAYELEPGESRFMDIDFAWLYGELQKGKYKMIKEIYLPDGRVYSVPAEFEIQ